jgi:hypothetical protein
MTVLSQIISRTLSERAVKAIFVRFGSPPQERAKSQPYSGLPKNTICSHLIWPSELPAQVERTLHLPRARLAKEATSRIESWASRGTSPGQFLPQCAVRGEVDQLAAGFSHRGTPPACSLAYRLYL